MTTSKFWRDIQTAYMQVAADNNREVTVTSDAENLTAHISYDTLNGWVSVKILAGKREMEVEGGTN